MSDSSTYDAIRAVLDRPHTTRHYPCEDCAEGTWLPRRVDDPLRYLSRSCLVRVAVEASASVLPLFERVRPEDTRARTLLSTMVEWLQRANPRRAHLCNAIEAARELHTSVEPTQRPVLDLSLWIALFVARAVQRTVVAGYSSRPRLDARAAAEEAGCAVAYYYSLHSACTAPRELSRHTLRARATQFVWWWRARCSAMMPIANLQAAHLTWGPIDLPHHPSR